MVWKSIHIYYCEYIYRYIDIDIHRNYSNASGLCWSGLNKQKLLSFLKFLNQTKKRECFSLIGGTRSPQQSRPDTRIVLDFE